MVTSQARLVRKTWGRSRAPTEAFYLPHLRAWELLAGTLLAMLGAPSPRRTVVCTALSITGLLMLGAACFFYDGNTVFPGPSAALPVIGSVLIIQFARGKTLLAQVLGGPVFRGVGLISYSLYLWHWPIIALFQNELFTSQVNAVLPIGRVYFFDHGTKLFVLALSAALAFFSWRFVETPFRRATPNFGPVRTLAFSGLFMSALVATLAAIVASDGWRSRFSTEELRIADYLQFDERSFFRTGDCFLLDGMTLNREACLHSDEPGNEKSILIFGDSHAAQLWHGIAAQTNLTVFQATGADCRPIANEYASEKSPGRYCDELRSLVYEEFLPTASIDLVVLGGDWKSTDETMVRKSIAAIKALNHRVLLVGPTVPYQASLPRVIVASMKVGDERVVTKSRTGNALALDRQFRQIAAQSGAEYYSVYDRICDFSDDNETCIFLTPSGAALLHDRSHFTAEGSVFVTSLLASRIAALMGLSAAAHKEAVSRDHYVNP